ncbi:cupin domain-containing protein [Labrys okinawensis]|uniref:cupin domain-containing protein n=1 Tax=Labrys okinawensis TaxID=346911 RepID=UPI0039BCB2E1
MTLKTLLLAVSFALAGAGLASASDTKGGDIVTPAFQHQLPNIPGKTLTAVVVSYKPGGTSPSHTHARSAFVWAYVLSGSIRSQVDDGPAKVYRAGESWYEDPGAHHKVSENASKTKPASLLAVFVADSDEKTLTTYDRDK